MNYNPKSLKAEEFISHEEILETIKYAEENKNNMELIESLLEKARPKKTLTVQVFHTGRQACCLHVKTLKL